MVTISRLTPRRGTTQLWAYGYHDLAELLGLSYEAVKKAVGRGAFSPGELASVVEFAIKKNRDG